jgi:hypothetical protein
MYIWGFLAVHRIHHFFSSEWQESRTNLRGRYTIIPNIFHFPRKLPMVDSTSYGFRVRLAPGTGWPLLCDNANNVIHWCKSQIYNTNRFKESEITWTGVYNKPWISNIFLIVCLRSWSEEVVLVSKIIAELKYSAGSSCRIKQSLKTVHCER